MLPLGGFEGKTVIITGANGMLGRAFAQALEPFGARVVGLSRSELDVTDRARVLRCATLGPDVILHCAAMALADECERDPARAREVHYDGTRNVAQLALSTGARVFYPQSVFVFDGTELPVTEQTVPAPRLVYGTVKLMAERFLLDHVPGALSVRLAGFFGGDEKDKNFVGQFVRQLREMLRTGQSHVEVGDRIWQPSYTLDHARNVLLLLSRHKSGIYHMGAIGEATFHDVATECVRALGLADTIDVGHRPPDVVSVGEVAARPSRMVTANRRLEREGLSLQRSWRDALHEYLQRPHFDDLRRVAKPA